MFIVTVGQVLELVKQDKVDELNGCLERILSNRKAYGGGFIRMFLKQTVHLRASMPKRVLLIKELVNEGRDPVLGRVSFMKGIT